MSKPLALTAPVIRWQDVFLVVGGSVLTALSAQIAIPLPWTPVPVTLQPLAVMLTGAILGSRRAAAAIFLYLLEGVAGLPVFTPVGPPGLARIMGPTGGYLMSYPLAAYMMGYFAGRGWTVRFRSAFPAFLVTSYVILFFGGTWMVLGGSRTWSQAFMLGILPFIPWDLLKILFAASLTSSLRRTREQ